MATTTNAVLRGSIYWIQRDTQNLSTFIDSGEIGINLGLDSGSGESQVSQVFYETRTLPVNGTITYDLTDLSRTILGSTVDISFTKIRGLVIRNKNTESSDIISLTATGTNALTEIVHGFSGDTLIYPQSSLSIFRPVDGFTVDSSHKIIKVNDLYGYGASYDIVILGV